MAIAKHKDLANYVDYKQYPDLAKLPDDLEESLDRLNESKNIKEATERVAGEGNVKIILTMMYIHTYQVIKN